MYLLYEESSQFKVAKVLADGDSTLQVENAHGKRSKIKRNTVIFQFEQADANTLLDQAQAMVSTFDVPFLWECAPQEEFKVDDFAQDYYGAPPSVLEKTALLLCLHSAPVYFHRKGKGIYRPAPPDILKAALAAVEKKQKQAQLQEQWTEQLVAGQLPAEFESVIHSFLTHPDKNQPQWKAFEKACTQTGLSVDALLLKLNVYPHELALHLDKLIGGVLKKLPKPQAVLPPLPDLPLAQVQAYSLDNESTTEIDDAIAVQHLGGNRYQVSVHIAAPALAVERDCELDLVARQQMATIYMPGFKIPMQADNLIAHFSLDEGKPQPCLSLYFTADIATGEILETHTQVESLVVAKNLRTNQLEGIITRELLEDETSHFDYDSFFKPLWALSKHLAKKREEVRGKPEYTKQFEFSVDLDGPYNDPNSRVIISPRLRDEPIDMIVAEMMIFANQHWAKLLKDTGLPGIFRTQQFGRVKQSTHPAMHEGIGVEQYAWMTSPLRRYCDLLNQRQVMCAVEHGVSARLVAPYKPKDSDLFTIMAQFESLYTQWRTVQDTLERYWVLRWLQQNAITTVQASVIRSDGIVRLTKAPLVLEVPDMPTLDRFSLIELKLSHINLLDLTVIAQYQHTISTPQEDE